jgi:hypothetical protein
VAAFYLRADALCRCAAECCRQHERFAHLVQLGAIREEQRAARTLVALCDDALAELATCYEKAGRQGAPERRRRLLARRQRPVAGEPRVRAPHANQRARRRARLVERGDRSQLAELALDYDLEASALLLLKQATEAVPQGPSRGRDLDPGPARVTPSRAGVHPRRTRIVAGR